MLTDIINCLVNVWLAFCTLLFYVMLYGDESKVVHRWSFVGHWSLRGGLILLIVGAAWNALTWRNSILSETVLNVGLASVFTWAYLFHRKMFVGSKKNSSKTGGTCL